MQDNLNYAVAVEAQSAEARSEFIWKTYAHVVAAILTFAGISAYLITSGVSARLFPIVTANWLLTLGAFVVAIHAARAYIFERCLAIKMLKPCINVKDFHPNVTR